jgi:1-deoxy-D-xylulose-5-phosphate reductoisomerase
VLNAANEVAVEAFLDRRLRFTAIAEVVAAVLAHLGCGPAAPDLEAILAADAAARVAAAEAVCACEPPRRD